MQIRENVKCIPSSSPAFRYLAETVVEERNRRKNSRKFLHQNSWDSPGLRDHAPLFHTSSHGPLREEAAHLEHLGLERLRRADPHMELAEAFDLDDDSEGYEAGVRERAYRWVGVDATWSLDRSVWVEGAYRN